MMSIQPNSQEALVTVRLPKLSEVVAVQLTVSLLYKCPGIIEASVREEKQIFSGGSCKSQNSWLILQRFYHP